MTATAAWWRSYRKATELDRTGGILPPGSNVFWMLFLQMAWRNLSLRPVRTLLTVVGIAVAVAAFITLVGMSRGLENAWINSLVERGVHLLGVHKGAVDIMTATLDEDLSARLARVRHVKAVSGELIELMALDSRRTVLARGWPRGSYLWRTLRLDRGHLPEVREPAGIVLGPALAEGLNKWPGSTLRIRNHRFLVTGIASPASSFSNNTIFMQLAPMQDLMDKRGKVTGFCLNIDHFENPALVAELKSTLAKNFPDLSFSETSEIADNNEIIRLLRAIAWSTSLIALIMALVVISNTLLMAVAERTREMGILSALGWQAWRVLMLIVLEGLLLSLAGSLAGTFLGLAGMHWLAALPRLQGFFEPRADLHLMVQVLLSALLLGVAGSLYPAWRAVRLNPVDALKYE